MTTYNTGNPLGSTDPHDLYDNAQNLDELTNSQSKLSHPDRRGVSRKTWHGMEQDFQDFLASSGYIGTGTDGAIEDYAAGIEVTSYNQIIRENGELWRLAAGTELPYTTDGAGMPEGGAFVAVGDAALRQALANTIDSGEGALLVRGAVIYVDTIADLQALPTSGLVDGHQVQVKEYHAGTQLGGGTFYWDASSIASDNGGTVFGNSSQGRWKRSNISKVNVADFGVTGNGNESTRYQAAVDYAIENGIKYVTVDVKQDTAVSIANRSRVIFVGRGALLGANTTNNGSYRRSVTPEYAPTYKGIKDFDASLLDGLAGKTTINAVIVGDSLTTYGAVQALSVADVLPEQLEAALLRGNPNKTINFYNRGIGGGTYANLDGVAPANQIPNYAWYTDDTAPWLDYVESLSPDVVFLSFGMNDGRNFQLSSLLSVVAKIEAFASAPHIVFITNMVPNLSPDPKYSSFGTYLDQEGRDYVAGFVRSYARYYGYPVIDINRTFNIIRDGRDILRTYFVPFEEVEFTTPSGYLGSTQRRCRDFSAILRIDPAGWTASQPFSIAVGEAANNVVFVLDAGGFLELRFFHGGTGGRYNTVLTDIPTPTTTVNVEASVVGNTFMFRVTPDAGPDINPITARIIRSGGLMRLGFSYFSNPGVGPVIKATVRYGVEQQYMPLMTDDEIWGVPSDSVLIRPETGGNGLNHPTSMGASIIYGMHLDAQNFRLPS